MPQDNAQCDPGEARDDYGPLTERQANNVADLAATRAEERFYTELGRSIVRKALLALGTIGLAFLAWLTDFIHLGHH